MKSGVMHFTVLVAIIAIGIIAFVSVRGNAGLQFFIGLATAIAYVVWGIIHHSIEGDLHKKIVVEYVLIAAIAVLLLEVGLGL